MIGLISPSSEFDSMSAELKKLYDKLFKKQIVLIKSKKEESELEQRVKESK